MSTANAVTTATQIVGLTSATPLPATMSMAAVTNAAKSSMQVIPLASTPDGFTLIHPGFRRNDYRYDSDTVYQATARCSGSTCTTLAQVSVQFAEVAIGGSSHAWQLTVTMRQYSNQGGLTWSYSNTYWCGVNVSGASDHTCDNGAAPSNGSMSVNTLVNEPWGRTNNITTFPMVMPSTLFSNGVRISTRFRGYDTLSRATTTKLNTSSGNGN